MRIGIMLSMPGGTPTVDGLAQAAQQAEAAGFASAWLPQVFDVDALTALAFAGRATTRIELGTAVVPTYPRHPLTLAQQALTAQSVMGGRLALGIGLSHKIVIENMLGLSYTQPIPHTREYLTVLNGLLAGEAVRFKGEHYQVNAQIAMPGVPKPPVLVAALGPDMLRVTGLLADGTITWMGGLPFLRDVAVPRISEAAAKAGRPTPRVVAMAPVCATNDPEAARANANKLFAMYNTLPSYRAALDRGGAAGPGDVAVVGDEVAIAEQIAAYGAAGVTDFVAAAFPGPEGGTERTAAP